VAEGQEEFQYRLLRYRKSSIDHQIVHEQWYYTGRVACGAESSMTIGMPVTFSCYHRRKVLDDDRAKGIVVHILSAHLKHQSRAFMSFIIMPEQLEWV
jgi:hypothetical protein